MSTVTRLTACKQAVFPDSSSHSGRNRAYKSYSRPRDGSLLESGPLLMQGPHCASPFNLLFVDSSLRVISFFFFLSRSKWPRQVQSCQPYRKIPLALVVNSPMAFNPTNSAAAFRNAFCTSVAA